MSLKFYSSRTHVNLHLPLYGQTLEIPPALTLDSTQAPPAEPERALRACHLSAHPVPLLFLPEGMQGMSLFGIFRAKVTRPWEPSKGTCPIGHCAVGTLPAAFHPFRRPKARQKGGIPENFLRAPLFGSPRATSSMHVKNGRGDKPRSQITKRPKGQGFVLKRKTSEL